MPFKTLNNWLFDGNIKRELSIKEKEILFKYNSPITLSYIISIFLRNQKLNSYLNDYFNNINIYYLDKEELFNFIKKAVIDYNVKRFDIVYYKHKKYTKEFNKFKEKYPELKDDDINLLINKLENTEDAEQLYRCFGLEIDYKKEKIKTKKEKVDLKNSVKKFIEDNFKLITL